MISSPAASVIAARHGIHLVNCDLQLSQKRYCDSVLVMDVNWEPWREFFVRATILHPDSDWKLFAMDYSNYFDVAIYGYNRLPLTVVAGLLNSKGIMINIKEDACYKRCELE